MENARPATVFKQIGNRISQMFVFILTEYVAPGVLEQPYSHLTVKAGGVGERPDQDMELTRRCNLKLLHIN